MNPKLLRVEWRAVRRASLRLMQHSLSLVGLLAVALAALIAMHPEYARSMGRRILPSASPQASAAGAVAASANLFSVALLPPFPDPLGGAIAHPVDEAGRMLGLVAPLETDVRMPSGSTHGAMVGERPGTLREKRDVVQYLSKKYRVNADAVAMLVDAAYLTGKDVGLDPLLLLSVMGVESGFNPFAESTAGASGLMQLMAKVHRDKLDDFGGQHIALNPVVNLRVGAVVLKDCIRRGGSLVDGLRLYVGAGTSDDSGYGARVLQEKDRLGQAARGLAVRTPRVEPSATPVVKAAAVDVATDPVDVADPAHDARAARGPIGDDPDHGRFASL